jgi:hypothetical protein
MARTSKLGALALVGALSSAAGMAAAAQLNVSQIATGTSTSINWTVELGEPNATGWSLSYFSLATASIDSETSTYFAPDPWSAGMTAGPGYPSLTRSKPMVNYTQGNSQFVYDRKNSRLANVNMASPAPRTVDAEVYDGGASGGAAEARLSYRAQISNTTKEKLDYFLDLKVPTMLRANQPAYDLCCSGDSNGGTYSYHKPKSWKTQAAVDLLVDGLPVWSSEQTALYPDSPSSPFDEFDIAWGQANGPSTTTLFLGRLAPGQSISVSFIVRTDAVGLAPDCGTQPPGSYLDHTYTIHCFELDSKVNLVSASPYARGPQTPFRIYAKAPFVLKTIPAGDHPQVIQPGVKGPAPAPPKASAPAPVRGPQR